MYGQWLPGQTMPMQISPNLIQALGVQGGAPMMSPYTPGMGTPFNPAAANPAGGGTPFNPQDFMRNPSVQMALIQAGSRLLQGRNPGQTTGGAIGEAASQGMGTYVANEDRRLRNDYLKQQMEQSKKRTVLAENADKRQQAASEREAGMYELDKEAKGISNRTANEALRLQQLFGEKSAQAKLDEMGARTGYYNAQADKTRADAKNPEGTRGPISFDDKAIGNLAAYYKEQMTAAGNEASDAEIWAEAAKDWTAMKSAENPAEMKAKLIEKFTAGLDPNDKLDKPLYSAGLAQANTLYEEYLKGIPNVKTRGATIGRPKGSAPGTAPSTPPVGTGAPAAPVPGSSPSQGGAGPGMGVGMQYFNAMLAKTPTPNAATLQYWRDEIRKFDPTFDLPPQYQAR